MKLKISFKHLNHTPALDERIKEKSEKLDKYFEGNTSVSWTCWVSGDDHWAEIKAHGPKFDFFGEELAYCIVKESYLAYFIANTGGTNRMTE